MVLRILASQILTRSLHCVFDTYKPFGGTSSLGWQVALTGVKFFCVIRPLLKFSESTILHWKAHVRSFVWQRIVGVGECHERFHSSVLPVSVSVLDVTQMPGSRTVEPKRLHSIEALRTEGPLPLKGRYPCLQVLHCRSLGADLTIRPLWRLAPSLTVLELHDDFNEPLFSPCPLPLTLVTLRLGRSFNQPLLVGALPKFLSHLSLYNSFSYPLDHLPAHLSRLTIRPQLHLHTYQHPPPTQYGGFQHPLNALPSALATLKFAIPPGYCHGLIALPSELQCLSVTSCPECRHHMACFAAPSHTFHHQTFEYPPRLLHLVWDALYSDFLTFTRDVADLASLRTLRFTLGPGDAPWNGCKTPDEHRFHEDHWALKLAPDCAVYHPDWTARGRFVHRNAWQTVEFQPFPANPWLPPSGPWSPQPTPVDLLAFPFVSNTLSEDTDFHVQVDGHFLPLALENAPSLTERLRIPQWPSRDQCTPEHFCTYNFRFLVELTIDDATTDGFHHHRSFGHPLPLESLPGDTLRSLTIGHLMQPFEGNHLRRLRRLVLSHFIEPILSFPPQLRVLDVGEKFAHSLRHAPCTLTQITVAFHFCFSLLPPSAFNLTLRCGQTPLSLTNSLLSMEPPPSVRTLRVVGQGFRFRLNFPPRRKPTLPQCSAGSPAIKRKHKESIHSTQENPTEQNLPSKKERNALFVE